LHQKMRGSFELSSHMAEKPFHTPRNLRFWRWGLVFSRD
jgi:hypothetical protein